MHLYLQGDGSVVKRLRAEGVEVLVLPFRWQGSKIRSVLEILRHVHTIARLIRLSRIDVVMAYTLNDLVFAGIAARITRKPLFYRSQADVVGGWPAPQCSWLGSHILRVLRVLKAHVVTTTRYELESYRRLGYPEGQLCWIPLGVEQDRFTGSVYETSVTQMRKTFDRGYPIVGIFARLVGWKGHRRAIEALAELKKVGIICDLLIVGDHVFGGGASYKAELEALGRSSGISTQLRFLGHRDDVNVLMGVCDLVVHASDFEPFGLVLVEAMSAGRSVVAMDLPGPRESVLDGQSGILVPVGEVQALASAMRVLIEDPMLRARMGKLGRERVVQLFDEAENLRRLNERMLSCGKC